MPDPTGPRPYNPNALQALQDALEAEASFTGEKIQRRLTPQAGEVDGDRFHPPHLHRGNMVLNEMLDGVDHIETVHESLPAVSGLRGHILRGRYSRARDYAHEGVERHATILRVAEIISRRGEAKSAYKGANYLTVRPSPYKELKERASHASNGMSAIVRAWNSKNEDGDEDKVVRKAYSLRPTTLSQVRTVRRLERKAAASRSAFSEVSAIKKHHGVKDPTSTPSPDPIPFDLPPTPTKIKYPVRDESQQLNRKERRNRKKADHHAHMHHGHEGPIRKKVNAVGKKVAPVWFLSQHEKAEKKRDTFQRIAEGKDWLSLGRYKNRRTIRAINRAQQLRNDMDTLAQRQAEREERKQDRADRRAEERAQGVKWYHKVHVRKPASEHKAAPEDDDEV